MNAPTHILTDSELEDIRLAANAKLNDALAGHKALNGDPQAHTLANALMVTQAILTQLSEAPKEMRERSKLPEWMAKKLAQSMEQYDYRENQTLHSATDETEKKRIQLVFDNNRIESQLAMDAIATAAGVFDEYTRARHDSYKPHPLSEHPSWGVDFIERAAMEAQIKIKKTLEARLTDTDADEAKTMRHNVANGTMMVVSAQLALEKALKEKSFDPVGVLVEKLEQHTFPPAPTPEERAQQAERMIAVSAFAKELGINAQVQERWSLARRQGKTLSV